MNPLFPTRSHASDDWSIPNLNRFNRDASLPMNYGDYHTINTNAALKQFSQWKRNGNTNAVKPLLDLTKKTTPKNTMNDNNITMNNSVNNPADRRSFVDGALTKKPKVLSIKEEDELKVDDNSMNYHRNDNNKIIINKPLVQAPPKPVQQQIKQIIPSQSISEQQPSNPAVLSPSTSPTVTANQPQSSSSSPPSAMFYLFFFITSLDSLLDFERDDRTTASSSSSASSPLTILFEISINQQQLLQMEALHELLLSFTLSSDIHPLDHRGTTPYYQPKFRTSMSEEDVDGCVRPFEFRLSDGGWEISVGDG